MSKVNQYISLSSGDLLPFTVEEDGVYLDEDTDIESIKKEIRHNLCSPSFRIFVLYPDETINYEIPNSMIQSGGKYDENYQDGQRRSLSFTLYNFDGSFSPSVNKLWAGTRLRLDLGIKLSSGETIWFQKGIYVITKVTPNISSSKREVSISASDKFCLFENAEGKLETSYTIEIGTDIESAIKSILTTEMGNGYVFDPKDLIYNSAFKGKTTQAEISVSAGSNYGDILLELGTQLSAEVFYNAAGNLTYAPINDVSFDTNKPLVYEFETAKGELDGLTFDYNYSSIVNRVIVVGSSNNGGTYQGVAINGDPKSPLCYQRVGLRTGNIINDSNITSQILAEERAEYELRQQLILKSTLSASVLFNPFLEVNNLIAISDEFFDLDHERYLIQSVSCSLDYSGATSISFSDLNNLSTEIEIGTGKSTAEVMENLLPKMTATSYPVYIAHGEGIELSFVSLDPQGATIADSGTKFQEGETVYGFVILKTGYFPQEGWRAVNNSSYKIGSLTVSSDSENNFGTQNAKPTWKTVFESSSDEGELIASWAASAYAGTVELSEKIPKVIKGLKKTKIKGYLKCTNSVFVKKYDGQSTFEFEDMTLSPDGATVVQLLNKSIKEGVEPKQLSYNVYLATSSSESPTSLTGGCFIETPWSYFDYLSSTSAFVGAGNSNPLFTREDIIESLNNGGVAAWTASGAVNTVEEVNTISFVSDSELTEKTVSSTISPGTISGSVISGVSGGVIFNIKDDISKYTINNNFIVTGGTYINKGDTSTGASSTKDIVFLTYCPCELYITKIEQSEY